MDVLGQVTTLAGSTSSGTTNGVGTIAKFNFPIGVVVNPVGTLVYVADCNNHNIRSIALPSGNIIYTMLFTFLVFRFCPIIKYYIF